MTDIPLLVPMPDNHWEDWKGAFLSDNPQLTVSMMGIETEEDWRKFADDLKNRVKGDKFEIPTHDLFPDWRSWADAMSLSSVGKL